jgi:2-polyprenyl-3-methyl-5-hydroxy-6-metoxy-1,4-benzoquinol methylase
MEVAQFFDTAYRQNDRYWWQSDLRYSVNPLDHRTSLLTQALLRLIVHRPPGRALDLGAGEGTDAIRLARLGYQVDALDISFVAAEKIAKFASAEGLSHMVSVHQMDAVDFSPKGPYDIIIGNGLLHYVEKKEQVIGLMREATVPGGLNVLSLWSTYTPLPSCHDIVPVYADEEDGIVTKLYADWHAELLYLERDKTEFAHSDLPPHRHSHIKLIARNR